MEDEDRCHVVDGELHGCSRVRAAHPQEAPSCFEQKRILGRVQCRACGADVTAAVTPPRAPLLAPMPFVTAEKPSPDIGLLLELNAERRAIAEMLKSRGEELRREADDYDIAQRDEAIEANDKAEAYEEAEQKVRARIVVGIAAEDTK